MKHLFLIIFSLFFLLGSTSLWADDEPIDECSQLQEKINIFSSLEETVARDFARITDKSLCDSMSAQCDYFYSTLKRYHKEYRNQCQEDYEIPTISICDYAANPCVKKPKVNPFSAYHARR